MWYYESLANHRPCNAWADDSHRFAAVRVIWYNNCVVPLCFEDLMRKKTRDYTPNDLMAALGLALEVGSTQTLLFLVGLRRYTLPNLPPPHLTSTPTPPQIGNTFEDAMANALIACTCRFVRRVDPILQALKQCCPMSSCRDTPSRVHHPHTSPLLPLLYTSPTRLKTP